MKNKIILIIPIIVLILVGVYIFYNRPRMIEEITNINLDDIAYIESETNLNLEEFMNAYKEAKFKKCRKYHMGTVSEYKIICYDEQNNVILTIRVGNDYRFVVGEYGINNPSARYKYVKK